MSGLPTLRVRESIHLQKIEELKNHIKDVQPQTLIMKKTNLEEIKNGTCGANQQ